ncbi:hypothetical protein cypCar_00021346, partial [Cyprinus carpio]
IAKMGGEQMQHLNNSSPVVDASLYGYGGQKRSLDEGVASQLGAMVHGTRAIITEDFKVPDKMVGFIIGRGGEQITRIQLESNCKIQIASVACNCLWCLPSDSGGMMDRPCTLTGTPESIEQAKRLLGQIVDRCRNGPGFHTQMDGNSAIQEILIPASKVGLVIGKGGDTIKQLQERTGVKMIMIQDDPMPTGSDKPLRITGDPYKVQQARELVAEIIREKDQGDFRSGRSDFGSRLGSSIDVAVPRFAVGIVIGRNGEMIKKIQNDAGVRIQFKPDDGISPDRIAQVMGQPDRCQHAVHLINDLVQTAQERDGFGGPVGPRGRGRGRGDWNMGTPGGLQEVTYTIPADKCGLVIGKGGETIKSINQQSGAHVELQRNPPPNTDPNVRIFSIRGSPQQMEMARQLIDEKIGLLPHVGDWNGRKQQFWTQSFHPRTRDSSSEVSAFLPSFISSLPVSGPRLHDWQVWEHVPNMAASEQRGPQLTMDPDRQNDYPNPGASTRNQGQSSGSDYSKAWEELLQENRVMRNCLSLNCHSKPLDFSVSILCVCCAVCALRPPVLASHRASPPRYSAALVEYYRQQGRDVRQDRLRAPRAPRKKHDSTNTALII